MALRLERLTAELTDLQDAGHTLKGALRFATLVTPCDVASVSLLRSGGRLDTAAGSDSLAERAHELQDELGQGPCLQAEWPDGEDVQVVESIADDERWPRWGPQASRLGLSSRMAVKLSTTNDSIGVLDLCSYLPRHYDPDDLLAARMVATRMSAWPTPPTYKRCGEPSTPSATSAKSQGLPMTRLLRSDLPRPRLPCCDATHRKTTASCTRLLENSSTLARGQRSSTPSSASSRATHGRATSLHPKRQTGHQDRRPPGGRPPR
jgi:GAF domain